MIKVTIGNNIKRNSVIIDENTTLRAALEQAGIASLDGVTLQAGDLDKTFASFGIAEKCYLLNVVKADNAAEIKIVGGVAVVESGATLETVKKLQKYRPNSLCLFEGTGKDKEAVFVVGAGSGHGTIGKYGVSFGAATTTDGKATVTLMIPEGTTDPKKWVMENVGVAILNLNKVEAQFTAASEEIESELTAIEANISVM